MVIVMDSETRGLYGEIFLLGCYDGTEYRQFYTGVDFMEYLLRLEAEAISVYCFNLDFDLAKLVAENNRLYQREGRELFRIDYGKSLIITNRFHTAKIKDTNITFRDLYPLVNTSLDRACKDFELTTKKLELDTKDKERYFKTVSPHSPELQEYLKHDVLATFELYQKLLALSGLEEEQFQKSPTLASLAMRIFRHTSPKSYEKIKVSMLRKREEEFVRSAYSGGRVEIFRNELNGKGYHYDINSLYPHVMEINRFPVGEGRLLPDDLPAEKKMEIFNQLRTTRCYPLNYILHAKVRVPKQHVAPLPHRRNGLIFPTGTFTGHFCSPEVEFALEHCGVEVLEVYNLMLFFKEDYLFTEFISKMKEIKLTAQGAKRTFAKLIQNSLYGKFGMGRMREQYELHTPEREEKLRARKVELSVTNSFNGSRLISYFKLAFADYIRPQYAAFITSYARVELLRKMLDVPPEHLYYCDTDSIVSAVPFKPEEIDAKAYGKWKLEREVSRAIFILPKLYAEIDLRTSEDICKSKGIVKDYQEKVTFMDYIDYYKSMVDGRDHILYGYTLPADSLHAPAYHQRRKLMSAIKAAKDVDEKIILQKKLLFSQIRHKRVMNFSENTSEPIDLAENSDIILSKEVGK